MTPPEWGEGRTTPSPSVGRGDRHLQAVGSDEARTVSHAPERLSGHLPSGLSGFVGRERELAEMQLCLKTAGQGQGMLVLVAGEPGIGKTRLVSELTERAKGWQVLAGRAYQFEGMPPYLPFAEGLRPYVRVCPVEELRTQLGVGAADVALLVPEVRSRLPDLDATLSVSPEHERYRLFESVADFLVAIAQSAARGLLFCLDDLHWADSSTLLMMAHLARRLPGAPILLVGTYRSVELGRTDPLADVLADLSRERLSRRMVLDSFSLEEATRLIDGLSGRPAAPPVAAAIYHKTEGNPFFLEEVVRHLQAEGRDLSDPRTAGEDWGIPEGVRQVTGRRLSRLSPEANRLLQAGAILGDGFTFDVLRAVTSIEEAPLMDALDETIGAGVIREEGGGYHFTHALIRQTITSELSLPRRQRLHLRAAEAIEQTYADNLGPHLAALAHHFALAARGAGDKAVDYAARAGERAAALLAYDEATSYYEWALQALEASGSADAGRHCDLLLALGDVRRRAGDVSRARETLQRAAGIAREARLPERLALAALGYGARGETEIGTVDEPQVALLEEALRALGEEDSGLRARVLGGLARALYYSDSLERRSTLSQRAVAMARRVADPETLAYTLSCRRAAIWGPESTAEQLDVASELVLIAEEVGDREMALQGRHWRLTDLLEMGEIEEVDAEIEAYARAAKELRQPLYLWYATLFRAMRALLDCRFEEGEQLARQALATGQRVQRRNAKANFLVQMFVLRREQGRLGELEATLTEFVQRVPAMVAYRCALAYLYCELGRTAEARREFEHLAAHDFAGLPRDAHWLTAVTFLAEVCASLGDAQRATLLYRLLLPYSDRNIVLGAGLACRGAVSRPLGLLAATLSHREAAEQHFEDALTVNARLGARCWLANTYLEYATMLLEVGRRDDRSRAREMLEGTLGIYEDVGLQNFAAKVQRLLADPSVARISSPAPTYPDDLSAREVEVLRLIAAGRSNQEIAAALFISPNTVARHVNHIFHKTGATNRVEAARYATRQGLAE